MLARKHELEENRCKHAKGELRRVERSMKAGQSFAEGRELEVCPSKASSASHMEASDNRGTLVMGSLYRGVYHFS